MLARPFLETQPGNVRRMTQAIPAAGGSFRKRSNQSKPRANLAFLALSKRLENGIGLILFVPNPIPLSSRLELFSSSFRAFLKPLGERIWSPRSPVAG